MILPLFFSLIAAAGQPSRSNLQIAPCEIGEHRQFEIVECPIELKNMGDEAIAISDGEARLPWDKIDSSRIVVPPKSTKYIVATVDLRNDEGEVRRSFRFKTDEPGQPRRGSEVRGFVIPLLDQHKPTIEFGIVRLGDEPLPSKSFQLSSSEVLNFRVAGIEAKPDWIDASISGDGRSLHAALKDTAPWGLTHLGQAYIKLRTNTSVQSQVWIEVTANVIGEVAVDANPLQLGVLRTGSGHEFLLRVSSRSGRKFEIGKLDFDGIDAKGSVETCTPSSHSCRLVRIKLSEKQAPGKLEGRLSIGLPEFNRSLSVDLVGMLLTPQTKIHQLEELMQRGDGKGGMSTASRRADIATALRGAVREEVSDPPGTGPLLRWSVTHQGGIYGYALYRSSHEGGPFVRINPDLVRAIADGDDKSGRYKWRDNSANSGTSYWYKIGIVERNGSKRDLTAAQQVTAK